MTLKQLPVLLLLFPGIATSSKGQLCGYDFQNMFILDIRREGAEKQARDVQVYLAGANGIPLLAEVPVKEKKGYRTEIQPTRIVPNSNLRHRGRKLFPRAGDYFVVLVSNRLNPRELPPAYQAMVVDGADTSFHWLPFGKSLNICQNHLPSNHPAYLGQPMTTADGQPFLPLRIVPGKAAEPRQPAFPLDSLFFVFRHAFQSWSPDEVAEALPRQAVTAVEVYDHASLRCIQVLRPSERFLFPCGEQAQHLVQTDVFGDNPALVRDLILTSRVVAGNLPGRPPDIYRDYFLFNERKQQYVRWTSLSEFPNVTPDENGWPRRFETSEDEQQQTTRHYVFDGEGGWRLTDTETRNKQQPAPIPESAPVEASLQGQACLEAPEGNQLLPPVFVAPAGASSPHCLVSDTMALANACRATLSLKVTGQFSNSFDCPRAIAPGRILQMVFRTEETISPGQVRRFERECQVQTGAGQYLPFVVRYFVAGEGTALRDTATGSITGFRGSPADGLTAFEVLVDEKGIPLGYGEVLAKSKARAGTWAFFDEQGKVAYTREYSRPFIATIANPDSQLYLARLEIRKDGRWLTPEHIMSGYSFTFHCTEAVDSIRIICGSRYAACRYRHKGSRNQAGAWLHLMEAGGEVLYSGDTALPLGFPGHRYVIRWSPKAFEGGPGAGDRLKALRQRFPGLPIRPFSNHYEVDEVDLGGLREADQRRLLQRLSADPAIEGLSRVVSVGRSEAAYSAPTISVVFEYEVVPGRLAPLLEKHGFLDMRQQMGDTHYYEARYRDKLCDRAYFEAVNALSREPGIHGVYPNFYIQAAPDGPGQEVISPAEGN